MNKYYYKKRKKLPMRLYTKLLGVLFIILGVGTVAYVFFPLISYLIFIAPAFADQAVNAPIPQATIVDSSSLKSMIASTQLPIGGTDYSNVSNWFPSFQIGKASASHASVSSYTLSIPAININNAKVTTVDTDLSKHLVNIANTAIPPQAGNTVIFGHSTLPMLYDPNNYKTIFANAHTLKVNDKIIVKVAGKTYNYSIFNITVVPPTDT